jgi:hypothetical protein
MRTLTLTLTRVAVISVACQKPCTATRVQRFVRCVIGGVMSAITLKCDSSAVDSVLDELDSLVHSLDGCVKFRNSGINLSDLPDESVRLESNNLPTDTGELVVRLYPTDLLLCFLAACRARNSEFVCVEH